MQDERKWWIGPLHLAGLFAVTILAFLALVAVVVAWVLVNGSQTAPQLALGPGLVIGVTLAQQALMVAVAAIGAALVPPLTGSWRSRSAANLALAPTGVALAALAAGLGLVGVPMSIAIRAELLGRVPSFVEDLLGPLVGGPPLQVAAMVGMLVVGAPVSEELLFRGYLWSAFARSARSTWVPALVTSALFLGFHADPLQMLANVPTVAVAALVRARTGSIWACIAAHVGHNALAVAVGWVLPEPTAPLLGGALSAVLTVAGAAALWQATAPRLSPHGPGATAGA